jgi:short-subunit dehydrogenase
VTGASSGIGKALARDLAARGHALVLIARRRVRLEILAAQLTQDFGVRVDIVAADVTKPEDRAGVTQAVSGLGLTIDVLVLCAGFGMVAPFIESDPERLVQMIRTNVEATVALARAIVPDMVTRRSGSILMVSSMAGNQPMPNFATYAATKAAVTSIAESLHCELKPYGITVTALCPASVSTEFAEVAQASQIERRQPRRLIATPEQCSQVGLAALARGRRTAVPLLPARMFVWVAAHMPRSIWLPVCRRMFS